MFGHFPFCSHITFFLLCWLVLSSCQDLGTPVKEKPPCPTIRTLPQSPFGVPIWHPSGNFLGFNYTPIERIEYPYGEHCQGRYFWKYDSMGFWLVNSDGTNMRRVCFPLDEPAWSPDGQWIAFVSQAQIFKMRFLGSSFDTTKVVQLTFEGNNFSPAWSPDDQWIAYDSNKETANGMNFVWKMKFDGSQKQRIAYEPTQGEIRMPHWSPSGIGIAHIRYLVGTFSSEVFYMDNNGMNPARLTYNSATDYHPRYSPDGTKIAFSSKPSQGNGNIWLMNSDGSNPRQLTIEGSTTGLSWSPNGRKIAYVIYRFTDWSYANGTIWTIDVETGEQIQLTFNNPPTDLDL